MGQWLVQTIQDGVSVFRSTRGTPTHTAWKECVWETHTHTPWGGITPVVCNIEWVFIFITAWGIANTALNVHAPVCVWERHTTC